MALFSVLPTRCAAFFGVKLQQVERPRDRETLDFPGDLPRFHRRDALLSGDGFDFHEDRAGEGLTFRVVSMRIVSPTVGNSSSCDGRW